MPKERPLQRRSTPPVARRPGRPVPRPQFGDYEIRIAADAGNLSYTLQTLTGAVVANGQGLAPFGQMPRFDGTLSGDPEFLGRLPAIAGGAARPSGPPGHFEIHWPPR